MAIILTYPLGADQRYLQALAAQARQAKQEGDQHKLEAVTQAIEAVRNSQQVERLILSGVNEESLVKILGSDLIARLSQTGQLVLTLITAKVQETKDA